MSVDPYNILRRKRAGDSLSEDEIREVVRGATDGSWSDAQLAAFLMATAIRGLDPQETQTLTLTMLESGEQWGLAAEFPQVVDKHSTGGVGDKVSLILAPLLAACGLPVVMLTGRRLGHTGGTADKLESIPGLDLHLDRERCRGLLRGPGIAIGLPTSDIAPADRRLYALRHATATVESVPLVIGSILSKKLAVGAAAIVFDVKTGNGAFFPEIEVASGLAQRLVETSVALGRPARALLTDMSQPLGAWVGHTAEVRETLDSLSGAGEGRLMEVTFSLCEEVSALVGRPLSRGDLQEVVRSGAARECFERWATAQGASRGWLEAPDFALTPVELVVEAERQGVLAAVETRELGFLVAEAGLGAGGSIDFGVSLHYRVTVGEAVEEGQELCRLYLRREEPGLVARARSCFRIAGQGAAPPIIHRRLAPSAG